MSGLIVEFNGRGFWDKRNHDIWYYHLSYLVKQSENMPHWALEWADKWLELAPKMLPGFMFMSALKVIKDDDQIALMVELSHKLLERFENYDDFLEVEKEKWLADGNPLELKGVELAREIIAKPTTITSHTHWEMVSTVTPKQMWSLPTFGTLFIRLLTGENWKRAYFNSYAEPFFVAVIDTLSQWVSPDEIGLAHATGLTRYRGSWLFWVSPSNANAYIEDLQYKGQHICHGIPDLLIEKSGIEDKAEYDALYLEVFLEDKLREQWMLDFDKRITLLLSAENGGYTKRYAADADIYSPALQRTVNLSAIYQTRF